MKIVQERDKYRNSFTYCCLKWRWRCIKTSVKIIYNVFNILSEVLNTWKCRPLVKLHLIRTPIEVECHYLITINRGARLRTQSITVYTYTYARARVWACLSSYYIVNEHLTFGPNKSIKNSTRYILKLSHINIAVSLSPYILFIICINLI